MAKMRDAFIVVILLNTVLSEDIPGCDFFDTVDLTNHKPLENGSYAYEDVIIPQDQTGEYNYQILFGGKRRKVPQHTRGCVCQIKSCVRFCYDLQSQLDESKRLCIHKYSNYSSSLLNITLIINTEREVDVQENFIIQKIEVPCKNGHFLKRDESAEDKWSLYENGMLHQHYNNMSSGRQSFCLQLQKSSNDEYRIVPCPCYPSMKKVKVIIQSVSIICLILTIGLRLLFRQSDLRFIFYYACIALSFFVQIIEEIFRHKLGHSMCLATGYFGYFVFISMYLYLLDLNRYIWISLKLSHVKHCSLLKSNMLVGIGAGIMLLATSLVDLFNIVGDEASQSFYLWKPGFALYTCWIKTHDWSALVFYFGPISIILLISIILGNLTAWRCFIKKEIYRKTMKNCKDNSKLFKYIYLMLLAGVTWTFEIISYLTGIYWFDLMFSAVGIFTLIITIIRDRKRIIEWYRNFPIRTFFVGTYDNIFCRFFTKNISNAIIPL